MGTYPHLMGISKQNHLRFWLTNLVLTHNDLEIENLKIQQVIHQMMPSHMSIQEPKVENAEVPQPPGWFHLKVNGVDVGFLVRVLSIHLVQVQENIRTEFPSKIHESPPWNAKQWGPTFVLFMSSLTCWILPGRWHITRTPFQASAVHGHCRLLGQTPSPKLLDTIPHTKWTVPPLHVG